MSTSTRPRGHDRDRIAITTRDVALGAVIAAAVTAVSVAAKTWCGLPGEVADQYLRWCYSDVVPLWFVERLNEGAVPYVDHAVEYPVLTGLWMWLAASPTTTLTGFVVLTAVIAIVSAAVTGGLLGAELGWRRALAFAAAPTLAISGFVNWDLPAVALATGGLVAHRRGRDGWAGVLLGLGAAAKLYPVLFVLPLAAAAWKLRGRVAGQRTLLGGLGAWWAVNLPVAVLATDGWTRFFVLSAERVSDWDALTTVGNHLVGWPSSTPAVNVVSALSMALATVAVLVVAWRRDTPAAWHLTALPLLAAFLLTNKVYSPQFSLWVLPLLALAFPGWGWWLAFAVTDVAVTITRFPYLANFVGDGGIDGAWPWWPFATSVVARAVVLGAAAVIGWRRAVHGIEPPPPQDTGRVRNDTSARDRRLAAELPR